MFVTNGKGNIIRLLAGIFISSLTGFCLLEKILVKLGVKEQGSSCGI